MVHCMDAMPVWGGGIIPHCSKIGFGIAIKGVESVSLAGTPRGMKPTARNTES